MGGEGLDGFDAVNGRGDDAAGISGTFATGVETAELGVLHGLVAGNPDWGGGAAFHSEDACLRGIEAVHLGVELL